MQRWHHADKAYYLVFETMDDATEYRDFLRDYGIYAEMVPNVEEFVLAVQERAILDNFEREILNMALVEDPVLQ